MESKKSMREFIMDLLTPAKDWVHGGVIEREAFAWKHKASTVMRECRKLTEMDDTGQAPLLVDRSCKCDGSNIGHVKYRINPVWTKKRADDTWAKMGYDNSSKVEEVSKQPTLL